MPTNVMTNTSVTSVGVSWDAVNNATTYRVTLRGDVSDETETDLTSVSLWV